MGYTPREQIVNQKPEQTNIIDRYVVVLEASNINLLNINMIEFFNFFFQLSSQLSKSILPIVQHTDILIYLESKAHPSPHPLES